MNVGDKVSQGDIIGKVGGIGASGAREYDPHIHFEVIKNGEPIDPLKHLAKDGRGVQGSNCTIGPSY